MTPAAISQSQDLLGIIYPGEVFVLKKEDLHIERRDRYEWLDLIDRWIFDERDRKMLVRVLLDGASVESCQELVGLERRQTQRRFDKAMTQLAQHC